MTIINPGDTSLETADDTVATAALGFEAFLTGKSDNRRTAEPKDNEAEEDSDEEDAEAHEADAPSDDAEDEEGDEPDASDDDAEATDEDDDAPKALDPAKDKDVTVNLKIGDKIEPVTLEELSKGYLRQSDYSRKTAAIAETRKQVEEEAVAVRGSRETYSQLLTALETKLSQLEEFDRVDFDELYRTDPHRYVREIEAKRERDDHLRAARAETARIEQERMLESQKARQARQAETWKAAIEAVPAWRDEKTWAKSQKQILDYATGIGFSQQEINAVCSTDPRVLLAMHAAAEHHRLLSNKPKASPGHSAPAARTVSRANAPKPADQYARQKMRLRETGRVEDAAALFERLLK